MEQRPREARIGLLGTSFMGRAHARGFKALRELEPDPACLPRMVLACGRDRARLDRFGARYGFERTSDDWRQLVADPEIDVFDNAAPNDLHAEPAILAAEAGKHVICEKPLGRDVAEARRMLAAAEAAGVVHMCAFNYRFFPAVALARELIEAGAIGEPRVFRGRFLLGEHGAGGDGEVTWRMRRESAGSGVVGDLLAHHLDLARFLVGEPVAVGASSRAWPGELGGAGSEVEDSVVCALEFAGGALGSLEAGRALPGQVLVSAIEVDGSEGGIRFDLRNLNELTITDRGAARSVNVTGPEHPFAELWWPPGHGIGWADSFTLELRHFLGAVAGTWPLAPHGATFFDGLRCAEACEAVLSAAASGTRQPIAPADQVTEIEERR